eukprot:1151689-Pelagomonas_calceolata.AAC.4
MGLRSWFLIWFIAESFQLQWKCALAEGRPRLQLALLCDSIRGVIAFGMKKDAPACGVVLFAETSNRSCPDAQVQISFSTCKMAMSCMCLTSVPGGA